MEIYRLPARTDNYIFVLHDPASGTAAVVDPADAPPVLDKIQALNARLIAIFNTHHHGDHVGGNHQLLSHFPEAIVYASKQDRGRIPGQQHDLEDGNRVIFGDRTAQILFVPGHTRGHIAYYFAPTTPDAPGDLFCGDTLFAGGCGRLLEGTPADMQPSLAKLRALPDNTHIWCAHEYTLSNLKFAISIDQSNEALRSRFTQVTQQRRRNQPTVPSLLEVEKATNPFLRWDSPTLQTLAKSQEPVEVLGHIRSLKDHF